MSNADLPALIGGVPLRPEGPPTWPIPDDDVLAALQDAYASSAWGQYHGGIVERFEARLADYFDCQYALCCASGTFAVETALRALRVNANDEVILPAYDYPGNFLSIHAIGAHPVLVDVDANNWNMRADQIEMALSPKTKAIIVPHLHGGMVGMSNVMDVAHKNGVAVLEDAAQCPGAHIDGKMAGSWGDVGVLSFGGSKLLTAGRGGAILTNSPEIHQRLRMALLRGNHICPLSELQAAVLEPQLEKLAQRNEHRLRNVRILELLLADVPGLKIFKNTNPTALPAFYKVGFQYDASQFGLSRDLVIKALRMEGIAMDAGFRSLHVGRSQRRFRADWELPEATLAHEGTIILHHPVLLGNKVDMEIIAKAWTRILTYREQIRDQLVSD